MHRRFYVVASFLLFAATACLAQREAPADSPAFTTVPELAAGFHSLYAQNFEEAREKFTDWESRHPDEPFGYAAIAASYLFEELYRQGVLSSDFFLNEKRFLHGIEGKPDPGRTAVLRFIAADLHTIVVQIYDPRRDRSLHQSWVNADHLEIWTLGDVANTVRVDPAAVRQTGIDLDGPARRI